MRSMLADQPYSDVVRTQGESIDSVTHNHLLNLVAEHLLHQLCQWFELGFQLLELFLLIFVAQIQSLLRCGFQLLSIELLELLYGILIHGVHHVKYLKTLLAQIFQERRRGHDGDALASDVINVVLPFLHAVDVFLQADLLIPRLGCVEPQQFSDLGSVRGVLMDTKLQALAKLFIELLVVILLLGNFCKHLQALLHKVLLDHTQDLVLLQSLPRDVQRKILRIHDTLDKIQPLWNEVLPIVRQRFVEGCILFIRHILRLPHPERLVLVQLLPLMRHLLHLLRFLLLFFFLLFFVNLLDLRLIALFAFLVFLFLLILLGISDLLLLRLFNVQLNGEANEFRVLLHQIFQSTLLQELGLVLLQIANDLRASLDLTMDHLGVLLHGEGSARRRLPDVLFIVVVLADHTNLVRNQVRRVEPYSKLSNHGDVAAGTHGLHKSLGTRLGDRPEIVHELVLCHPNARILDGDGRIGLVWDDLDEEVWLRLDLFWVGDGLVPDLVEGIGRIRNQFAEKDFLVGVKGVDDQAHQLLNVGIEGEGLRHGSRKPGTMLRCDDNKACTKNGL